MSSNCCIASVTPCAIIPKDLKHFAKNIDDDFVDFGGVEQGPEAQNPFPEEYFQIPMFWRKLLVVMG